MPEFLDGVWRLFSLAAAAALFVALTIPIALRLPLVKRLLDIPNHRSLHTMPTPRIGGLGIALVLSISVLLYLMFAESPSVMPGVLLLVWLPLLTVSLLDDWRSVHPGLRLSVHLLVSAVWVCFTFRAASPGVTGYLWLFVGSGVCLAMAWMINLYNFMDGMDGLATGMGGVGFVGLAWLANANNDGLLASVSALMAGGSLGVWVWNRPPARVFLGDTGSVSLGFAAAALGVWGWSRGTLAWWTVPVLFAPFVVDASYTLVARLAAGKRPWEAHREHLYQKLALSLGRVGPVLGAEYTMMLLSLTVGIMLGSLANDILGGVFALLWLALLLVVRKTAKPWLLSRLAGSRECD